MADMRSREQEFSQAEFCKFTRPLVEVNAQLQYGDAATNKIEINLRQSQGMN